MTVKLPALNSCVLFKALARGNRRKFGLQNQIKTIFNFNFYFHLQLLHKPVIIRISSFWIRKWKNYPWIKNPWNQDHPIWELFSLTCVKDTNGAIHRDSSISTLNKSFVEFPRAPTLESLQSDASGEISPASPLPLKSTGILMECTRMNTIIFQASQICQNLDPWHRQKMIRETKRFFLFF